LVDQTKTELKDKVSYADHTTFRVGLPEAYYLPELVRREIAVMEEHMALCSDQYTAADVEHANHYLEQLRGCLGDLNLVVSGIGNA
jgi:hypothetical protein